MSQGLFADPVPNDNEKIEPDDGILKSVNPPAKNKKKNLQKRRRLKEQRKRELEKVGEKIEKKKIADLYKYLFNFYFISIIFIIIHAYF